MSKRELTCIAPQLSSGAKDAVKSYVGWTDTVQTYGGKGHNQDDIEETRQIVEKMAEYDQQYENSGQGNSGKKSNMRTRGTR